MRVRLESGRQRELIYEAKYKLKVTWRELAQQFDVTPIQLKEWRLEHSLIPYNLFMGLCCSDKYERYILEILPETWGQTKGGFLSYSNTKPCRKLEKSEELAELIGILLGDGNTFRKAGGRVLQVRIATNRRTELAYSREFIYPLMRKLTGLEPSFKIHENAIYVCINSKGFIRELELMGIHSGNKIRNRACIPQWIFSKKSYLQACIRGLVDTDGCIHQLSKKDPNLGRISFKNFNPKLLEDYRKAMFILNFHPSKVTYNNIFVTRKSDLIRYRREIGSSNPLQGKQTGKIQPRSLEGIRTDYSLGNGKDARFWPS